MKKTIQITQEHIDTARAVLGKKDICTYCPVALALRDSGWPEAVVGYTGPNIPSVKLRDGSRWIDLPQLQWFVNSFDAKKEVVPISFEFDPE
jgi:hypothetical protein